MKKLILSCIICIHFQLSGMGNTLIPDKPARTTFTYEDLSFEVGLKKDIKILYQIERLDLAIEDEKTLDSLQDFLIANPFLTLEIIEHTDSRGNEKYNRQLSARRARIVVDYLVSIGISSDRLTSRGAGEDELLLSDEYIKEHALTKPEKELLHFKNRRTELKISGTDYVSTSKTEIILPEKPCINKESLELLVGDGSQQITLSRFSVLMLTKSFQKKFPDVTFFSEKDIFISYSKDDCKKNILFIRSLTAEKPELLGKKEEREIYRFDSCKNIWEKSDF